LVEIAGLGFHDLVLFFGTPPASSQLGVRPNYSKSARRNIEMKELMLKLYREEAGQDLTEYALLLVLVALVAITTMKTLGNTISNVFANAASNLTSAT
jgi:pilus assembly protein Flp/PilA